MGLGDKDLEISVNERLGIDLIDWESLPDWVRDSKYQAESESDLGIEHGRAFWLKSETEALVEKFLVVPWNKEGLMAVVSSRKHRGMAGNRTGFSVEILKDKHPTFNDNNPEKFLGIIISRGGGHDIVASDYGGYVTYGLEQSDGSESTENQDMMGIMKAICEPIEIGISKDKLEIGRVLTAVAKGYEKFYGKR